MSNTPFSTTFNTRQEENFTFQYHDFNGILDTTTPATVTSDHPEICSVTLGADGRSFLLVAEDTVAGAAVISLSLGANPGQQNHVNVAVTPAPDLSSVNMTAGPIIAKP